MNTLGLFSLLTCVLASSADLASAQCTTRVSVDSQGTAANWYSGTSQVSRDGRYVAFESFAWNLALLDANNALDIFVHDRTTSTTTCASLNPQGVPGNGQSQGPSLSTDARFVVFTSTASDLVAADTNGHSDVFVHDRATGTTQLVSVGVGGAPANADSTSAVISGDGRYVAFASGATNLVSTPVSGWHAVYLRDLVTGATVLASHTPSGASGNGSSSLPAISEDGRYVAFQSAASNLLPEDPDTWTDVFVFDRATDTLALASVSSLGIKGNYASNEPSLSADGKRVAFLTTSTNLHPQDTNTWMDAYVHDLATGTTELVGLDSNGLLSNRPISTVSLSPDGGYAVFSTDATNLWPLDTDVELDAFLRDFAAGTTQLVSLKSDGTQANKWCGGASISDFGRAITLTSGAKLVPEKGDGVTDVFVRDAHCEIANYCTAKYNSQFCQPSLSSIGAPAAGGFDHFRVRASLLLPEKMGMLIWSRTRAATPFAGGLLCVAAPIARTRAVSTGGDPAVDCSGSLEFAFSPAYLAAQGVPAGTEVFAQVWSRDPGYAKPNAVSLSDGLRFVVGP